MKKINLLGALAAALSVFSVVSCNKGDNTGSAKPDVDSSKTIVLSGPEEQKNFVMKWAQKYLDDNNITGYTLSYATHGEDKVDSEVTDWTNAGAPDIYAYACDKTIGLYQAGAIAEVTDANLEKINANISDKGIESATFNGTVYGYPFTSSNGYFVYYDSNIEGLDEVIKTNDWNKWVEFCKTKNYKIAYSTSTAFYTAAALNTFGAGWDVKYNRDGSISSITCDYNTEKGYKAGKFIYDFMQSGVYADTQAAPDKDGDIAICINGAWALSNDDKGNTSAYNKSNIKMTTLPNVTVDGETAHIKSFYGTKIYGVNPQKSTGNTEKLNLLHNIAYYLITDEVQEARFDDSQQAPTSKKVNAMEKVQSNASVQALTKQSADGVAQANLPTNVWDATSPLKEAFLVEDLTKEQIQTALETYNNTMSQAKK